uniref:Uncharacterized protein n=1 Tax=Pithovirus LCPAC101 TaxID=2506586 RepID=A0A481Z4U0_9VIRU|nr:MAG: hypothetical protein LCPAC101_03140 [Pithovirus LCPAC101]
MIPYNLFYDTYYGHTIDHLTKVYSKLKNKDIVFLAGDSSLDNKYWLDNENFHHAINGYEDILSPPYMKPDISYHLNSKLKNMACINCAVEASSISSRINSKSKLLEQDIFIRNNIKNTDSLVISLGGNDIALCPNAQTILNMGSLVYMNTLDMIKAGPNVAWGLKYFIELFGDRIKEYIGEIISKTKPKKIIICTIYYPDLEVTGGWADKVLKYINYDGNPKMLQEAINQIFIHATSKIKIDGVEVIPFPMYEILDGNDTNDYVSRVEPSYQGGEKIAEGLMYYL